jgi:hypothetical protein
LIRSLVQNAAKLPKAKRPIRPLLLYIISLKVYSVSRPDYFLARCNFLRELSVSYKTTDYFTLVPVNIL